jgi:hypothetical protein
MGEIFLNPITNQRQVLLENRVSSHSFNTKEILVSEFVKTISDIEYKTCDEIENRLQKISNCQKINLNRA